MTSQPPFCHVKCITIQSSANGTQIRNGMKSNEYYIVTGIIFSLGSDFWIVRFLIVELDCTRWRHCKCLIPVQTSCRQRIATADCNTSFCVFVWNYFRLQKQLQQHAARACRNHKLNDWFLCICVKFIQSSSILPASCSDYRLHYWFLYVSMKLIQSSSILPAACGDYILHYWLLCIFMKLIPIVRAAACFQ